jgi:hypothetical protein
MKPEEQRIAIAEACGFTYDSINEAWYKDGYYYFNCGDGLHFKQLPDYLNDLNAIHEAEKTLEADQAIDYVRQLIDLVCPDTYGVSNLYESTYAVLHATSAQRAEAFLKTIGKWVD